MNLEKQEFLYETHLHTSPVSRCGRFSVRENLAFYKSQGYAGVFITNHFIDGNFGGDRAASYAEQIEFYFSECEEAVEIGRELGIDVFYGVESSYKGTDFLVYGLSKEWFLAHPEIVDMKRSEFLSLMREDGAFIVQAHPFREEYYIDHICLFPRHVEGVEVINASNAEAHMNESARRFADTYGLIYSAGSDNHFAATFNRDLAGVKFSHRLTGVEDFIASMRRGEGEIFTMAKKPTREENGAQ